MRERGVIGARYADHPEGLVVTGSWTNLEPRQQVS